MMYVCGYIFELLFDVGFVSKVFDILFCVFGLVGFSIKLDWGST